MAVVNTNAMHRRRNALAKRALNEHYGALIDLQRINSASDDAAGLAIGSRIPSILLETGIRGRRDQYDQHC